MGDPKPVTEGSKSEREKYRALMLIYGISRKTGIDEAICSEGVETQRMDLWARWGKGRVGRTERVALTCACTVIRELGGWQEAAVRHNTGSPARCSVMTERAGLAGREGGDPCIIMADLWQCMAETDTTL